MQGFPRQGSSQGPPINHPNIQISNQSPFENRPHFQEPQFENRPVYDSRSGYPDQVSTSQFNTNTLPVPQQSASNVPNVPLPPGHKILINPHFRGAVQSTTDGKCSKLISQLLLIVHPTTYYTMATIYRQIFFIPCKQHDSYGIPLSNRHLCRPKFLAVSSLNLIRIKVRTIKANKGHRSTSKTISRTRAMYVSINILLEI